MIPADAHEHKEERVVHGIGVSPGIAIGPAFLFSRDAYTVEPYEISDDLIASEIKRFQIAVDRSERDLVKIASIAREKIGEASSAIFDAQALMLRDEALYEAVIDRIRSERQNASFAVTSVMSKHHQILKASESEYLRERANDLLDVQERILRHLQRGQILSAIDPDTIVVSETLTAADIVLFSRRNILGCALDFSGSTSHVSIMARSLHVPAVVGMHGISKLVENGDRLILDGLHGTVIVNPTPETLRFYSGLQGRYIDLIRDHKDLIPLPADTQDGQHIVLRANLEFKNELPLLEQYGAEGIGLFRTEILFLMQGRLAFSEDDQFHMYRQIVEAVTPYPTTFRVLDLGGDKMLPLGHREQNPFLGWRGIRVLLDKPDLLMPQLRAMLRASAYGSTRLLLPMVTSVVEVERFREVLDEVKQQLDNEGKPYDEHIKVGVMIEVPAVALMAERFAAVSDFFSIGSNDLTQYTLAVDRGNDLVSHLYQEYNPAVLALMKHAVDAARKYDITVGICGEMAASPRAAPLLVGLGIHELSASPAYLPEIKRVIRSLSMREATALAADALAASTTEEITESVDRWLREHTPDLVLFLEQDLPRHPHPRRAYSAEQVKP
jgi:phosphoenolpyruvate-protein phosphotransferase (PTS system enzyme I)